MSTLPTKVLSFVRRPEAFLAYAYEWLISGDCVVSRVMVTEPDVPPPSIPLPAFTAVISPAELPLATSSQEEPL